MIDPTRDEWLAARERVRTDGIVLFDHAHRLTEAAIGPCPPEPEPPRWNHGTLTLGPAVASQVWVGSASGHEALTPDEADAMADALTEHARYAREQGAGGLGISPLRMPGA